jgi:GlpG protein
MRIIGHLPNQTSAATFSDFLYGQGIKNEVEHDRNGWAIWVHSEDELEQAKTFLVRFLGDPNDDKFQIRSMNRPIGPSVTVSVKKVKVAEAKEVNRATSSYSFGPLTLAMIMACTVIALMSGWGGNVDFLSPLFMAPIIVDGVLPSWLPGEGLRQVFSGEIWRLVTPLFIHLGFLHLLFNMLWLLSFGSMIEAREGSTRLFSLVLVIGVISNIGQYMINGPYFGGMSGVIYGLLGYIWMKCRHDPGAGFYLNLNTVTILMVWFFLCLLGVIGDVANGAHAFGLVTGFVFGYVSSKLKSRG